jgi:hypothetical protein
VRRALVLVGCGILGASVSACQSTEQESAKIGREGQKLLAGPGALKLGALNRGVRVSDVTLLSREGRTAVAARLTNTTARPQVDLPVLVTVRDRDAKVLYSNDTGGLEDSLQRMAVLEGHQSSWWVDDQVLSARPAGRVQVRVGTGPHVRSGRAGSAPSIGPSKVSSQAGLSVLAATVTNRSSSAESKVAVFAVGSRAGKVVAGGRALIGLLAPHASAAVQVFLVGDPAGAKFELSAVPSGG